MAKKYIDFVIDDDGSVEIEAVGFTDNTCREATKSFEELGKVNSRKMKTEKASSKNTIRASTKS